MPTYTLQYTTTNSNTKANGNAEVSEIYSRYFANGKITGSSFTEADGVHTQVITFDTVTSYNEWYAEIDAIDTTEPSGVSYVGSGVYAD
jgi:hypothetical protein